MVRADLKPIGPVAPGWALCLRKPRARLEGPRARVKGQELEGVARARV